LNFSSVVGVEIDSADPHEDVEKGRLVVVIDLGLVQRDKGILEKVASPGGMLNRAD